MSDDSDPFTDAQKKRYEDSHKCGFCNAVKKLSVTRRIQLRDAMFGKTKVAGKKIEQSVIVKVLEGWGVDTSTSTVGAHIKGKSSQRELSAVCREAVASAWGADDGEAE